MARLRERPDTVTMLERGTLLFFYRPRPHQHGGGPQQRRRTDGVQRILAVLAPAGGGPLRLMVMARKQLPAGAHHDRFWAFVEAVHGDPRRLASDLGPQLLTTATAELRHLTGARLIGEAAYTFAWHEGHAHFLYELEIEHDDQLRREVGIERQSNYIVTVANPDPAVWGLDELPSLQQELFDQGEFNSSPALLPKYLQSSFGNRRWIPLDMPDFLGYPGTELMFTAAPNEASELSLQVDPTWERSLGNFDLAAMDH